MFSQRNIYGYSYFAVVTARHRNFRGSAFGAASAFGFEGEAAKVTLHVQGGGVNASADSSSSDDGGEGTPPATVRVVGWGDLHGRGTSLRRTVVVSAGLNEFTIEARAIARPAAPQPSPSAYLFAPLPLLRRLRRRRSTTGSSAPDDDAAADFPTNLTPSSSALPRRLLAPVRVLLLPRRRRRHHRLPRLGHLRPLCAL